jgi:GH15 family glucan-1,4-alpha-glucosidase
VRFYGFLSNATTSALVGPDGSVDWLPLPRFDSPSVFTRLLGDERHGFFRIEVAGAEVTAQRYLDGTNVLETVFEGSGGQAVVRDYLTVGRPELRRVIETTLPVTAVVRPVFGYGLVAAAAVPAGRGAVFQNPLQPEALVLAVCGAPQGGVEAHPEEGVWRLLPGRYELILHYVADDRREAGHTQTALAREALEVERQLEQEETQTSLLRTVEYWRSRPESDYGGPHQDAFRRSLLVLYGLTYRTNGAIIAAPTTSLPEVVGGTRQWDYRFAWVRDGSYAAEALLEAGDVVSARRFLEFLLNAVDLQGKPFPAPFFHVDGTLIRGERELLWLTGFRGSRPCREGNAATNQMQLDIEGDFLWTFWRYVVQTGDHAFARFYWSIVRAVVDWVAENWMQKDASLWEFRGQDAHYTHSKLMCWVALNYGAELARLVGRPADAERWRRAADDVRQAIESQGYNGRLGHYVQAFGGNRLDAALLTLPLYGYCEAADPRFLATLGAIERRLVRGPWVFRYESDMLGPAAHPFVLASSWLARVYLRQGEVARARAVIDGLLAHQTDLGLLGEHVDVTTGEPRGNFPQAFSHLGLVMALAEWNRAVRERAV